MRYYGKIIEDKDVITKEFLEKGQYNDGVITVAKLASNAKYWDEWARHTDDQGSLITYDWGHVFNWSWGTNQNYTFSKEVFDSLDLFWEAIVFSAGCTTTITFENPPGIIEMNKGVELHGTSLTFTIPMNRWMMIKKISTAGILLSGSYDQSYVYSGTGAPSNSTGQNGDVYIQYT